MKEILSERNVDIVKTCFVCFDGTNAMSDEKNGVQRRYCNCSPYSIYVYLSQISTMFQAFDGTISMASNNWHPFAWFMESFPL